VVVLSTFLLAATMAIVMAANRKVDKTTTRSPSWQPIEKLITLPHGCHDGDRVVVLSTFLLVAMMAIVL
jgi:hypothetical protein